jgi:Fur family transcriptional regulator, ferric uptake regulator
MRGARNVRSDYSESDKNIETAFRDIAQRNTTPRTIIEDRLKELARNERSFTADDLLREVRGVRKSTGRATVFRLIDQLLEAELLGRVDLPDGRHRYFVCGDQQHHHHLVCTNCFRVSKFEYCLPESMISEIGESEHFTIKEHSLTLFGTCKSCSKGDDARKNANP